VEAIVDLTNSSSETDPTKISAFVPITSISALRLNNSISLRAIKLKFAPFSDNNKANDLPMPLLAPVIKIVLFLIDAF